VEEEFRPCRVRVESDIDIITLYGPHFYERVALASEVYGCLCCAGIDAHAIGSSVNSISMVVCSSESPGTRKALSARFEWPE
jgi:aspartokinase